jgi:hypothetical protein
MFAVEEFGEGEVVPALRRRPSSHRGAETEPAGLGAVDDDDERALAPGGVVAVDVAAARQHAVLDCDRG